jgi:hypothetical protein
MVLALQANIPDEKEAERRRGRRQRVLKKAVIVFNNGQCSMGCQILDISDTGAKLMPADIFSCPKEFVLKPTEGGPRHCVVMWRNGLEIGVRYEAQIATPNEQRNHSRRRVLQNGFMVFNGGRSSIACQILDLSDTGAKLRSTNISLCPREFLLKPQHGGPRLCAVIWRKGAQIGVRYL